MKILALILIFGSASAFIQNGVEYENSLGDGFNIEEGPADEINDLYSLEKRVEDDVFDQAMSDLNMRDVLRKVKEHLKKTVDPDLLKQKIEQLFREGSEILRQLLQTLKEKGRHKLLMIIDLILDEEDEEDAPQRGIVDYWEKVKNYFKDLKIDLQEKYLKFGEWVKNVLDKGMERHKDRMDNIKALAKEFLKHAKGISKEIASEAGEFFKNYKEELGNVWEEIRDKIDEIKKKKDSNP